MCVICLFVRDTNFTRVTIGAIHETAWIAAVPTDPVKIYTERRGSVIGLQRGFCGIAVVLGFGGSVLGRERIREGDEKE